MKYSVINPEDFETINWAGGTSTQLFIYPTTADYKKRNFDFRISTAKVEIEKSDFTSLPGVSRHLMILDGEIIVNHEDQYSKHLKPFDTDHFKGDWNTSSIGKCTDFNLMTRNNYNGELSSICLNQNESKNLLVQEEWTFLFLYVNKGEFYCELGSKKFTICNKNLLYIQQLNVDKLNIFAKKTGSLIISKIR